MPMTSKDDHQEDVFLEESQQIVDIVKDDVDKENEHQRKNIQLGEQIRQENDSQDSYHFSYQSSDKKSEEEIKQIDISIEKNDICPLMQSQIVKNQVLTSENDSNELREGQSDELKKRLNKIGEQTCKERAELKIQDIVDLYENKFLVEQIPDVDKFKIFQNSDCGHVLIDESILNELEADLEKFYDKNSQFN